MMDDNITKSMTSYANDNGYEFGGWHPTNDGMFVGHFHRLSGGVTGDLESKYVIFDGDGNIIKDETSEASYA